MMDTFRVNTDINPVPKEIRAILKKASGLILPYRCAVCGKASDTEDRFSSYDRLYEELYGEEADLHICGKCLSSISILDETGRWSLCLSNPVANDPCPGLPLYMPFAYQGTVKRAVKNIKFGKKIKLARFFGCLLGSCLAGERIGADIVVPIPLSPERLAERGFNQAAEIAYPVAGINGLRFADDVLLRNRDTKRQAEIKNNNDRAVNVSGVFDVNGSWDVTGMSVMIVDDVATSGATLHEAAEVLYRAGAFKVMCVAFAGNRHIKNAEPF